MTRAKKKKVALAETIAQESVVAEDGEIDQGEAAAVDTSQVEEGGVPSSPGELKREYAQLLYDEACLDLDSAAEVAKRAREAERLAERLFEAKEKRLDAKPKRALKNPWGKVRRGYEALLERLEAKWMAELRACAAAAAEASAHALLVEVKNLEIARLKRQLRRCGL